MNENDISYDIRRCAFKVHTVLGPGLLESAYQKALEFELLRLGYEVRLELPLPMQYENVQLSIGYRIDMLVAGKVIVELKSVDALLDVHKKQLLTYLKLSGCKLGLLINFNVAHVKEGIVRIVNGADELPPRTSA